MSDKRLGAQAKENKITTKNTKNTKADLIRFRFLGWLTLIFGRPGCYAVRFALRPNPKRGELDKETTISAKKPI